jgi:6,7-dimethyl-8-ribityllumazine synthase
LRNRFARQVNLNGTGVSISHGTLKAGAATALGTSCAGHFPPGANEDNSYLQVADVRGACNVPLVASTSLATARHYDVSCGAPIGLVVTDNTYFGDRVRHDTCPACSRDFNGTEGHIDHYASAQACTSNGVGDLGDYWSIRH